MTRADGEVIIQPVHRPITAALVLLVTCAPAVARADGADAAAAADELFERGKELLQAGNWPEACAKFHASMDLDPAVGTLLKIARCHEHEGKLTMALHDYRAALALNLEKTNQTEKRRAELAEYTKHALIQLDARVPKVRVVVPARPAGLRVTFGGQDLPLGGLDEKLPADPGPLAITAEAPGYGSLRRELLLRESTTTEVVLELVPVVAQPTHAAPSQPAPAPAPDVAPAPARSIRREAGFVVGGIGIVGLGIAGWFGLRTLSKISDSHAYCTPSYQCQKPGIDLLDEASTAQTVAIVSAAVGAAALGVGIYLVATAPAGARRVAALSVAVSPSGAFVRGAF